MSSLSASSLWSLPSLSVKVAASPGYQYDGTKGGVAWKMKVRGYFISKVPALVSILKWAEMHDQGKVTDEALRAATEGFLDSGLLYSSSFFFSLPSLHLFYQALRHVTS